MKEEEENPPPEPFMITRGNDDAAVIFVSGGVGTTLVLVATAPNHPAPAAFDFTMTGEPSSPRCLSFVHRCRSRSAPPCRFYTEDD